MDPVSQLVHGTIDFVLCRMIPRMLRRGTEAMVYTHVFRGRTSFVQGSRWATKRWLLQRQLDMPLWKRAIHVPEEGTWIELEDQGVQRDVEYVIQEHDAKRAGRHFDIRFVLHGTSVSWALPMKGKRDGVSRLPQPGERWNVIRQPDHAIEYNKFEGTIPDGQMGAGTVKIWAKGKLDIHKIEDGTVHFEIYSGVAKGRYVIVPMKEHGQGLLVAKRPEAVEVWAKPTYSKRAAEQLTQLEGVGRKVAERKTDGAAVELRMDEGSVRTYSHRVSRRTGVLIEHSARLTHLDDSKVSGLDGTRLRAEAWHPRGVNFLSGTLNSNVERAREIQRDGGCIRFDVFDITHYKGKDVRDLPYEERRALYEEVVGDMDNPYVRPVRMQKSSFADFYDEQVSLTTAPTDGVVIKDLDEAYEAKPWIKVKPADLADCEVLKVTEGTGKYKGSLGALTVVGPNGKTIQVGSGFSDWERKWIWDHRADMRGEVARVAFHVRGGQLTATGPRFDSWHPDKSEVALKMYSEVMDVSPYALKSAAGWRP